MDDFSSWWVFFFFKKRPPCFFHFLPSLSVHLLKSLSQGGTHQISIVDLLMPRSVLQRQRFHTQDEREMNTEDAGGDMGPWPRQPLPLWPLGCTGLGSERSWEGGAQIEVSHLYNNTYPSHRALRWPSSDWFLVTWGAESKPSCIIDFWGEGKSDAQTFACLLELAGQENRCSTWLKLNFSSSHWQLPPSSLHPARAIRSIPWCLVSDLQLACPVTSAHYCCISLRPLLNEEWDKASSERTLWSRRPQAAAPWSNVALKYLSAS